MINWKWPQTKQNNFLPWYLMLKNMLAVPFYVVGALFFAIGFSIHKGPKQVFTHMPKISLL